MSHCLFWGFELVLGLLVSNSASSLLLVGEATRWHSRPAQRSPPEFCVTAGFPKGGFGITEHHSPGDPVVGGPEGKDRNLSPFTESLGSRRPFVGTAVVCDGDLGQCWLCGCPAHPSLPEICPGPSMLPSSAVGSGDTERGPKLSRVPGHHG